MRFVISGCNGLVGSKVCNYLMEAGYEVLGLDRTDPTNQLTEFARVDLVSADLGRYFNPGDVAVHLAAIPSPGNIADRELFINNVGSTFNFLESASKAGVARVILASSISIYGLVWSTERLLPPELPMTEETPLQVADAYALSKEVDEATARMMNAKYGLTTIALRLPNMSCESDIRERSAKVIENRTYASRELWAYLDTRDVGPLIEAAATAPLSGANVITVVSPQSLGDIEIADAVHTVFPEISSPSGKAYADFRCRSQLNFIPRKVL